MKEQATPGRPDASPVYMRVVQKTNGLAIASLVLGIVWLYWIGSVLALVFAFVALDQIKKSEGTQGGRGLAIAGMVLGWVGVATLVLVVILAFLGHAEATKFQNVGSSVNGA